MSEKTEEKSPGEEQKAKLKDRLTSLTKRKRRPPRNYSSSSSSDEEDIIQHSIQTKAARNNLTVNNVRSIIKNVVSNACVVAAVQSRAEELERRVEDCKERITEGLLAESPDGKRMTRNRSKQLNRTSIPIADLSAAVQTHLPPKFFDSDSDDFSHDEDMEYQPNFNEMDSEDEYSTATCSDIDSQPRTPAAPFAMDDQEGVFKRPLKPDSPIKKLSAENRSTRSKMSLTETPIEAIQSPYIPPDLFADPLETMAEPDQPWEDFLEQFQKPLNSAADGEDGEETDPEYVYNAALDQPMAGDSINVPKREVDILLQELFDEVEEQVDSTYAIEFEEPPLRLPSFSSHVDAHQAKTETIVPNDEIYGGEVQVENPPMVQFPPGVDPLGVLLPHPPLQPNFNLIEGSDKQLYLLPVCNPVSIRSHIMSPSDQKTKLKTAYLEINVNDDWETILGQINHQKIAHYQNELQEARVIDGWTPKAMRIFHRQLLTHIQLVGQMFLQAFSHPFLWDDASHFMELLDDLMRIVNQNSLLKTLCWNIHDMHAICKQWEADLTVESDENQDYVRALLTGEWHPRVMERFVSHRAFIFPDLLPSRPAQKRIDVSLKLLGRRVLLILHLEAKNFRKTGDVKLLHIMTEFKKKYGETRTIWAYYRMLRTPEVREYLRTGRVPDIAHKEMEDFLSYDDVIPHANKPFQSLPEIWHNYVFSVERSKLIPREAKHTAQMENHSRRDLEDNQEATVTMNYANFQAQFQLANAPYYGIGDQVPQSEDEEHEISPDEGVCGLEKDHPNNDTKRRRVRKMRDRRNKSTVMEMIKKSLKMQKSPCKKRPSKILTRIRERKRKTHHLYQMLTSLDQKYDKNLEALEGNSIPAKLFNFFKEFDIYVQLMFGRMSLKRQRRENIVPLKRVDNKDIDLSWENRERLATEPGTTEFYKDPFFAWKYLKTVQIALKSNFKDFLDQIPKTGKCSVVDFYTRIEQLFIPDFKELLKMFLVHVLPRHVGQLGQFFEELVYKDADSLQYNLGVYMGRQRKQMRLIYNLLNELAQEEDMTGMISIKQRFIAILRGNPLILQWFLQLFPTERTSPTTMPDNHGSMQFSGLGNGIKLPGDLITVMASMVQEELPIPPLKLYLSDTDDESDSVVFVTEEPMEQFSNSMHSIASHGSQSQDSEGSFGIREEELMPHVSRGAKQNECESSFECYMDEESEMYVTDYTE